MCRKCSAITKESLITLVHSSHHHKGFTSTIIANVVTSDAYIAINIESILPRFFVVLDLTFSLSFSILLCLSICLYPFICFFVSIYTFFHFTLCIFVFLVKYVSVIIRIIFCNYKMFFCFSFLTYYYKTNNIFCTYHR
jgi:hypothetical protein